MNQWLAAALVVLVVTVAPALLVASRGSALQRLVGLEVGSAAVVAVLLLLAQGFARPAYVDVALVLAVLSPTGALVFTRFLGKSL